MSYVLCICRLSVWTSAERIYIYLMCSLAPCVHVYHMLAWSPHRPEKLDPLHLQLQVVVSQLSTRNWNPDLLRVASPFNGQAISQLHFWHFCLLPGSDLCSHIRSHHWAFLHLMLTRVCVQTSCFHGAVWSSLSRRWRELTRGWLTASTTNAICKRDRRPQKEGLQKRDSRTMLETFQIYFTRFSTLLPNTGFGVNPPKCSIWERDLSVRDICVIE